MRLPQGPWFPWSGEFRWDRFPWEGSKRRERDSIRDQRALAALVEAAATTIGVVATCPEVDLHAQLIEGHR